MPYTAHNVKYVVQIRTRGHTWEVVEGQIFERAVPQGRTIRSTMHHLSWNFPEAMVRGHALMSETVAVVSSILSIVNMHVQ